MNAIPEEIEEEKKSDGEDQEEYIERNFSEIKEFSRDKRGYTVLVTKD